MRSVIRFFKNAYKFRKALSGYYWWDYSGMLMFMHTCIEDMSKMIDEKGSEAPISKMKKVAFMQRAARIIDNHIEDRYLDMAADILGKKFSQPYIIDGKVVIKGGYNEVYLKALELEEQEWEELMEILKGNENIGILGMKTWWD
jgi:hypothetical protein